jgi:NAD(P)H dehydrogenase (quinone)
MSRCRAPVSPSFITAATATPGARLNLGLPPANNSTMGSDEDLNRLGFWLGAGAQSNTDQGPDIAPPEADLATARHLGKRVAEATLQFVRGRAAD